MGAQLELEGFDQVDLAAVREEMLAKIGQSGDSAAAAELAAPGSGGDLHRVGEVAMYGVDALCRRSAFLQQTVHADNAFVGLNPDDAGRRGFNDGHQVKVSQGGGSVVLPVRICEELPQGAVWVKSATDAAKGLGDSFGPVSVEAA
jgi:NADH-quinone oxidoreductase subunit G